MLVIICLTVNLYYTVYTIIDIIIMVIIMVYDILQIQDLIVVIHSYLCGSQTTGPT